MRSSSRRSSFPATTTAGTSGAFTSADSSAIRTRATGPPSSPTGPSGCARPGTRSPRSTRRSPTSTRAGSARSATPGSGTSFDEPGDIKIVAVHHHLIPIPGTGRERNIVHDAGDLLLTLTRMDVDLILCGHKHVPFFWGLNGMLLCSSGTAGTRRLRGRTPPSWNEVHVDATTIKVFLHYLDGTTGARRHLQPEDARAHARGLLRDRGLPQRQPGARGLILAF